MGTDGRERGRERFCLVWNKSVDNREGRHNWNIGLISVTSEWFKRIHPFFWCVFLQNYVSVKYSEYSVPTISRQCLSGSQMKWKSSSPPFIPFYESIPSVVIICYYFTALSAYITNLSVLFIHSSLTLYTDCKVFWVDLKNLYISMRYEFCF